MTGALPAPFWQRTVVSHTTSVTLQYRARAQCLLATYHYSSEPFTVLK